MVDDRDEEPYVLASVDADRRLADARRVGSSRTPLETPLQTKPETHRFRPFVA
jgi:hypothetical protein